MIEGVEDINIGKALDYIRDHARPLAEAKAKSVYLKEFRKSKKAMLVNQATGTVQERDAFAYSHTEYLALLEGYREAVELEIYETWMMTAAQAKIDIYRTQQANNRFIDKAHQ